MADGYNDIRPASEDPLGDPADTMEGQNVLPASQDPYGDPADQQAEVPQGVMPAGMDPYGDPALQDINQAANHPEFASAMEEHLSQMPSDDFQQSVQQASYQIPVQHQQSVVGELMGALQGQGFNPGQLASIVGLASPQPQQMGPQDFTRLLGWAQQNQPAALAQTVSNKPWLLQQLGNPMVQGVLQNLASRLLGR